jgi:hypothetical protein
LGKSHKYMYILPPTRKHEKPQMDNIIDLNSSNDVQPPSPIGKRFVPSAPLASARAESSAGTEMDQGVWQIWPPKVIT